jgi:hypothetical protein
LTRDPRLLLLAFILCAGCDRTVETAAPANDVPAIGTRFDPKDAGAVSGQVHWAGIAPQYVPISASIIGADGKPTYQLFPNPTAPRVNGMSGTVQGAVVFLDGVDSERARPWDHAAVRIETTLDEMRVHQGDRPPGSIAFVRVGDEVEFESRDANLHVVSARGAAFFGLPLPDANRPVRRRLTQPGLVELSSGAGRFWHRAYLWVGAHPYFALTDTDGRFNLPRVPAGDYRLVAWLPDGDVAAVDRDPNTGMVMRYNYAEPLRIERPLRVESGHTSAVDFWLSK